MIRLLDSIVCRQPQMARAGLQESQQLLEEQLQQVTAVMLEEEEEEEEEKDAEEKEEEVVMEEEEGREVEGEGEEGGQAGVSKAVSPAQG